MRILLPLVLFLVILGCQESINKNAHITQEYTKKIVKKDSIHHGKRLMQISCNICHSATSTEENRLAPPMIAVKRRYLMAYPSKAEFTKAIHDFVDNPTEENALMYGAIKRFGVMPNTGFPDNYVNQITDYLYDNEIEQPDWFEEHHKQNKKKRNHMMKKN